MMDFIWLLIDLLTGAWWYKDSDDEQRSCFWFIICLVGLCLLVGVIVWWIFG